MQTVAQYCRDRGLGADELAEKAGLDRRRVKAILGGNWTPSPAERARVAAALDLPVDEIAWSHRESVEHLHGHGPQFGRSP